MFFSQMPLVVSYYTKGTGYEEEASHLIQSCQKFAIEHCVEGIQDLGSWEKNCAFKPYFMQKKMEQYKRPLLWVDVDAVFLQPLSFEESFFADCALIKYKEETDIRFCVAAGTIYINATKQGNYMLSLWRHYVEALIQEKGAALPFVDQVGLYLAFCTKSDIHFALLPPGYCKIFDQEKNMEVKDVIIEQRQASRRLK